MSYYNVPRGIRNANPGNIKHGSDWLGLRAKQSDDTFAQFIDPVYGIRALGKLLKNYERYQGLNTVDGIIRRYAPSSENNTQSYIQATAKRLGVTPHSTLTLQVNGDLQPLVEAIIIHENGQQPYGPLTLKTGLYMSEGHSFEAAQRLAYDDIKEIA